MRAFVLAACGVFGCSSGRGSMNPPDLAMAGGGPDMAVATVCSPQDLPSCEDAMTIKSCRSSGTGYDYIPCPGSTCQDGACTCVAGTSVCVGNDVQVCGMDGMLHLDHTCMMGTACKDGYCGDQRCADEMMSTNPHALPTNAWPRFRHDNRNSGTTEVVVADKPKLKWKVFIGGASLNQGGLGSGAVVNQDNVIFVGGGDMDLNGGALNCLDMNGKLLWHFSAMRGFDSSTPAVRLDGTSYFSSEDSNLYAVDPMGKKVWQFQTGAQADSDPVVTRDGILVYSSDDGSLYALDFAGKLLWQSDMLNGPGEVDGGIAETCDGKIVVGGANGWMALDAKTGKTLWTVPVTGGSGAVLASPIVTADGTTYGFDSGGLGLAIDGNGKVIWKKQYAKPQNGQGGTTPLKVGNLLVVHLGDGNLHAMDAATGQEKWSKPAGAFATEINAGPIADGKQRIYFPGNDGFVYAFDTAGNLLWKLPSSGVANPAMDVAGTMAIGNDGTMYVPGNDGSLYAYQ